MEFYKHIFDLCGRLNNEIRLFGQKEHFSGLNRTNLGVFVSKSSAFRPRSDKGDLLGSTANAKITPKRPKNCFKNIDF